MAGERKEATAVKPANDNLPFRSLDNLPLFATDKELAVAIVGPKRAAEWLRDKFPTISMKQGFPPVDSFHGGRATVKVAAFYDEYIGKVGPNVNFAPDGGDSVVEWPRARRRA